MKYGLIVYKNLPKGRESISNDFGAFNVGDNIQMLALKRIMLEVMKVHESDIVEIDFHDLATYRGEYLVVPINLFFFGCHDAKEKWFPASPYIIPVFIGVHFSSSNLIPEEINYLMYYSPIGCRDEYTLSTMRKYNIPSYLFGCCTATLPKRTITEKLNTTYFVDVDYKEIIKSMPKKLIDNIRVINHVHTGKFSKEMYKEMDDFAETVLNDYKMNASLVVTSRLHCASPCAAMGIPTIMIVKEKSIRYAWLDKLIPIYSENEIDKIDWDIVASDYEETKNKMVSLITKRLVETRKKYELMYDISAFYEFRKVGSYSNPFEKMIKSLELFAKNDIHKTYIWGATALAEEIYNIIIRKFGEDSFGALIDEYNHVKFQGEWSVTFNEILDRIETNDLLIITPTSAQVVIMEMIRSRGIKCFALTTDGKVNNFNLQ